MNRTQPSSSSSYHPPPPPSLYIVKQTSLTEEKYAKNGIQKNIHVVVKNTPFNVNLSLTSTSPEVNFHRYAVEATLLYDCEEFKQVDFIRLKPMEYKSTVNESGDFCSIEFRIKVLTSQLEDMFFRLRLSAYDSVTHTCVPNFVVFTESIKVISKPDQIVKKKESKVKTKRTLADMMTETLARIEEQQREQRDMLAILTKRPKDSFEKDEEEEEDDDDDEEEENNHKQKKARKEKETTYGSSGQEPLEKEFSLLLGAFAEISPESKGTLVRRLILDIPRQQFNHLNELIDLMWAEGPQKDRRTEGSSLQGSALPLPMTVTAGNSEGCYLSDCPHKKELEHIDQFYQDFCVGSSLHQPL
eukprot:TRINITY_DN72_c1_g1_i1.p1 TRINITY_DN72_c1_g1~~TRINITY_DN72_c1_g1_i1.p1  ORF type:complete len:358 (-),score=96.40 TRINITY_DN72_c1_g1_i1:110-1183(-)